LTAALAYFTVIPAGRSANEEGPGPESLAWLPPIGAIVGAVAGFGGFAAYVWLHVPWSFVVAWALGIGLTGAIHIDGFLDACDGLFCSAPAERRLEILKDVRHGSFAVVGMALAAAFWLAALAAISPARFPIVLAFSGAASRLAAIAQASFFPYARSAGSMRAFARRPNVVALLLDAVLVEALAWFVAPWALAIAPIACIAAWCAARWASGRLGGGLTGDVYGALIVATEIGVLLVVGLIFTH
jgi:adenosylcobinamide-GDP ribazoletransferase